MEMLLVGQHSAFSSQHSEVLHLAVGTWLANVLLTAESQRHGENLKIVSDGLPTAWTVVTAIFVKSCCKPMRPSVSLSHVASTRLKVSKVVPAIRSKSSPEKFPSHRMELF